MHKAGCTARHSNWATASDPGGGGSAPLPHSDFRRPQATPGKAIQGYAQRGQARHAHQKMPPAMAMA